MRPFSTPLPATLAQPRPWAWHEAHQVRATMGRRDEDSDSEEEERRRRKERKKEKERREEDVRWRL